MLYNYRNKNKYEIKKYDGNETATTNDRKQSMLFDTTVDICLSHACLASYRVVSYSVIMTSVPFLLAFYNHLRRCHQKKCQTQTHLLFCILLPTWKMMETLVSHIFKKICLLHIFYY